MENTSYILIRGFRYNYTKIPSVFISYNMANVYN